MMAAVIEETVSEDIQEEEAANVHGLSKLKASISITSVDED